MQTSPSRLDLIRSRGPTAAILGSTGIHSRDPLHRGSPAVFRTSSSLACSRLQAKVVDCIPTALPASSALSFHSRFHPPVASGPPARPGQCPCSDLRCRSIWSGMIPANEDQDLAPPSSIDIAFGPLSTTSRADTSTHLTSASCCRQACTDLLLWSEGLSPCSSAIPSVLEKVVKAYFSVWLYTPSCSLRPSVGFVDQWVCIAKGRAVYRHFPSVTSVMGGAMYLLIRLTCKTICTLLGLNVLASLSPRSAATNPHNSLSPMHAPLPLHACHHRCHHRWCSA